MRRAFSFSKGSPSNGLKRLFKKQASSMNMKKLANPGVKLQDVMAQQEAKKKMKLSIKDEETKQLLTQHKSTIFKENNSLLAALSKQKSLQKGSSIHEDDIKMYN